SGSRISFFTPAVSGGVVYVGTEQGVFAVDAATGQELWETENTLRFDGAAPAVGDGLVYFGSNCCGTTSEVAAFDTATGARRWKFTVRDVFAGGFALAGGLLYPGSGGNQYALDAATGALVWRKSGITGVGSGGGPAVA